MLLVAMFATTVFASPVVVGLSNKHPLSEPQVGELLLGELPVAHCHSRKDASLSLERAAPDLSDIGYAHLAGISAAIHRVSVGIAFRDEYAGPAVG